MTGRVPFIVGLRTWSETEAEIRVRLEAALVRIRTRRREAQATGGGDPPTCQAASRTLASGHARDGRPTPAVPGGGILRRIKMRRTELMVEGWEAADAEELAVGDMAANEAREHVDLRCRVGFVREPDVLQRDLARRLEWALYRLLAGFATQDEGGVPSSSFPTDCELLQRVDDIVERLVDQTWSPAEAQVLALCDIAKAEAKRLVKDAVDAAPPGEPPPDFADRRARCEIRLMLLLVDRRMGDADGEADVGMDDIDEACGTEGVIGSPAKATPTLSWRDRDRIARRSSRLFKARQATASPLPASLRREERDLLMSRASGVSLVGPLDAHAADEMVADLLEELPWMEAVLGPLWRSMRRAAAAGHGLAFAPMLLVGAPGVGKSHLARRIADLSRAPLVSIDVGASSEGFRVGGVTRGWGTACPGAPVETILATGVGNVVAFVDEIDKGGTAYSTRGHATSAWTSLLGLLEPGSASRWTCPFYGVPFDMGHINWVLAANDASRLPAPLLSRLRVVRVEQPAPAHLALVARHEALRLGLDAEAAEVLAALVLRDGDRLDLRAVLRLVRDLADREDLDPLH